MRQPVGIGLFLAFLVALLAALGAVGAAILTSGYARMRYRFTADCLMLEWLWQRWPIRYGEVDGIFAGSRLGQAVRVRGVSWPGCHVGVGRTRAMGLVRYCTTTTDLDKVALVVTPTATFAISPADPAGFRRELIARVEAFDVDAAPPVPAPPPVVALGPLRDIALLALVGGSIALLLASLAYAWYRWEDLPDIITIHVGPDGSPDQRGPREDFYRVPGIGTAILLLNVVVGLVLYTRERAGARMLWATALVVQILVLIATVRILH
ncbi:MAG: PH domain-containing protein [Chloroflexota bacterium]